MRARRSSKDLKELMRDVDSFFLFLFRLSSESTICLCPNSVRKVMIACIHHNMIALPNVSAIMPSFFLRNEKKLKATNGLEKKARVKPEPKKKPKAALSRSFKCSNSCSILS